MYATMRAFNLTKNGHLSVPLPKGQDGIQILGWEGTTKHSGGIGRGAVPPLTSELQSPPRWFHCCVYCAPLFVFFWLLLIPRPGDGF